MEDLALTLRDGRQVTFYTIECQGQKAIFMNYGARMVSWQVPHPEAKEACLDLVLNYQDLGNYEADPAYLGALVGPVPNRIAAAKVLIGGKEYLLAANDGDKALHSSNSAFSNYLFELKEQGDNYLIFTYQLADMQDSLPGNRELEIRYELICRDSKYLLQLQYKFSSDRDTVCNLTNHSYFKLWDEQILVKHNLTAKEALADLRVKLPSEFFTPTDEKMLLTGEILRTKDSVFDFKEARPLAQGLQILSQLAIKGYDHNFIFQRDFNNYAVASDAYFSQPAVFFAPCSQAQLSVTTTEAGAQIYTANYLADSVTLDGMNFGEHSAFCCETQALPNSFVNQHFPSLTVTKDKPYQSTTYYEYSMRA